MPRHAPHAVLFLVLLAAPPALGDHIHDMQVTQRGVGPDHMVSLGVTYAPTGECCEGIFTWTTGDGGRGALGDGVRDGAYLGNASGQGHLSDGRLFLWERTLGAGGRIQLTIWYWYRATGLYTVGWADCCPDHGGTLTVIAL